MAADRQNQGQGRQNGGAQGGASGGQLRDVGQHLQEGAAQVGQRVREGYDSARDTAAHGYRQAEGLVARNPAPSVLLGFGVGFGLGVLLTALLTREEPKPWYERYTDSLHDLPDHVRDALHHARKSLRQGVEGASRHIPDSLRR